MLFARRFAIATSTTWRRSTFGHQRSCWPSSGTYSLDCDDDLDGSSISEISSKLPSCSIASDCTLYLFKHLWSTCSSVRNTDRQLSGFGGADTRRYLPAGGCACSKNAILCPLSERGRWSTFGATCGDVISQSSLGKNVLWSHTLVVRRWRRLTAARSPIAQIESHDTIRRCKMHHLRTIFSGWGAVTYRSVRRFDDLTYVMGIFQNENRTKFILRQWKYMMQSRQCNRAIYLKRGWRNLSVVRIRHIAGKRNAAKAGRLWRMKGLGVCFLLWLKTSRVQKRLHNLFQTVRSRHQWRMVFRTWNRMKYAFPLIRRENQLKYKAMQHYLASLLKSSFVE